MVMLKPQGSAGWTFVEPGRQYIKSHGIPSKQLPAGDVTPESLINEQIISGKNQIQQKYALQWQEVNRSANFLGPTKYTQMLRQIDANAKQEMLEFNQKAQQQLSQLQTIDRLGANGLISNANEIKWRLTVPRDIAESMFPGKRPYDPVQEYGKLDTHIKDIENELEQFRIIGVGKTVGLKQKVLNYAIYPVWKARQKSRAAQEQIQYFDTSMTHEGVDRNGNPITISGTWRPATEEDIQMHDLWLQEKERIRGLQKEILQRPDMQIRIVQPKTGEGTVADKIAVSVPKTKQQVIRQKNERTGQERVSYDGGKTWQITSG